MTFDREPVDSKKPSWNDSSRFSDDAFPHSAQGPQDSRLQDPVRSEWELQCGTLTYGAEVCVFCDVLSNAEVRGRQRHDEQQSIPGLLTDRTLSGGEEKLSEGDLSVNVTQSTLKSE